MFIFLMFSFVYFALKFTLNFEGCDAATSISTRDIIRFKIYLLNFKSFGHETWPTDRVMGNIFRNSFAWFGGRGTNSMPFSFTNLPQSIKNKMP